MSKTFKRTGHRAAQRQNVLRICLNILDSLHHDEHPTTRELAEKFDVSLRTMQNYVKELESLDVERRGEENRLYLKYAIPRKQVVLSEDEREFMRNALDQLDEIDDDTRLLAKNVAKKVLVTDIETPYYIQPERFEPRKRHDLIKALEQAIENHIKIDIEYEGTGMTLFPYKITAFEGIWYLLADGIEDTSIKNYMLSRISQCELTGKRFEPIKNLNEIIEDMESAYSNEGEEREIVIKVKSSIADFFRDKRHLKSQNNLETDDEGNLIISFNITHDEDVDNLIKSWLPDIEVLSPTSFKDRIKRELTIYLKAME